MREFRTVFKPGVSTHMINLHHKIITLGSCFSDAIGSLLNKHKIHTLNNPFGVVYNPHSIHKILRYVIFNEPVANHTFLQQQDIHLNYDFHSEFSSLTRSSLAERLKETIGAAHYFLKDAHWLIITYGTAWVYERNDTGEIVANCHKMPAETFTRALHTQKKILESFDSFYHSLKKFNSRIRIILTVSPVRHLRDTLEGNSVSKAILRTTCNTLTETYPDVEYFPSYEIMLDDLRDYRFYKSDMIHPTAEAENYIWEKFSERYYDQSTKEFMAKWQGILAALSHKPFHPSSQGHQRFLHEILATLEGLRAAVNVDKEVALISAQLTTKKTEE